MGLEATHISKMGRMWLRVIQLGDKDNHTDEMGIFVISIDTTWFQNNSACIMMGRRLG